jgi:Winged helix DNA-binding domain
LPPVESGRGHPKGRPMVRPNARLTWPGVLSWRLKRQRLDRRAPRGEALGVVREICGLHAQVMSSAELTLWARVEDLEPEAVQEALWERRSLAKTWAMRGTLHLLPADELPTGPATREEFARWFGATSPAQAGRFIEGLDEEVAPVEVEGTAAWMLAEHVEEAERIMPAGVVRLLPAFDHYVVAAPRDQEAVLPRALKGRVYRPQGWLSPVLLVDGRMEGVWRHERRGDRLVVGIEPFQKQPGWVRRATEEEAERLARFVGGGLALEWSSP